MLIFQKKGSKHVDMSGRIDFGFSCPLCENAECLASFEKRKDVNGRLCELAMCLSCHAVLNATRLREISDDRKQDELQAMSSDQFYAVDQHFIDNFHLMIERNSMIDFLIEHVPDLKRDILLDFGSGRGLTAASAVKYFRRVYAVELSLNVLKETHRAMPDRDRIILTDDYRTVDEGIDAITSMHVLEHLPDLYRTLPPLIERLNPGGVLFFQVPMLRQDYIVETHYTFFNEVAINSLAHRLSMQIVGIWYDTDLDFLTCILRK